MLGTLDLPAKNGRYYRIAGGPYREKPEGMTGVKLAEEIHAHADISIPIRDFSTPHPDVLFKGMERAVTAMMIGRPLYAGCMGGRGRTGLFMAALVKLWGIDHPVRHVRRHYYKHAVETEGQEMFIRNLKFPLSLRAKVVIAKWRGYAARKDCINPA